MLPGKQSTERKNKRIKILKENREEERKKN
jgi:hypothetical protein